MSQHSLQFSETLCDQKNFEQRLVKIKLDLNRQKPTELCQIPIYYVMNDEEKIINRQLYKVWLENYFVLF